MSPLDRDLVIILSDLPPSHGGMAAAGRGA
uniref:Uncharacterized protein n=1 Tax=Rhizophora mucronata TaxID=61149 RepID=A0A2P2MYX3_RHIMU